MYHTHPDFPLVQPWRWLPWNHPNTLATKAWKVLGRCRGFWHRLFRRVIFEVLSSNDRRSQRAKMALHTDTPSRKLPNFTCVHTCPGGGGAKQTASAYRHLQAPNAARLATLSTGSRLTVLFWKIAVVRLEPVLKDEEKAL